MNTIETKTIGYGEAVTKVLSPFLNLLSQDYYEDPRVFSEVFRNHLWLLRLFLSAKDLQKILEDVKDDVIGGISDSNERKTLFLVLIDEAIENLDYDMLFEEETNIEKKLSVLDSHDAIQLLSDKGYLTKEDIADILNGRHFDHLWFAVDVEEPLLTNHRVCVLDENVYYKFDKETENKLGEVGYYKLLKSKEFEVEYYDANTSYGNILSIPIKSPITDNLCFWFIRIADC